MKIALSGPSGSGKTTLVKYIVEKYGLPWINGSSGGIKAPEDNKLLQKNGLIVGKGHREVIQSGHKKPDQALRNQELILQSRLHLFRDTPEFVTDRSTIDNWVYYTMQCALYDTEENSKLFLSDCRLGLNALDLIIFVPTAIPIEDNGSRIPNYWYQHTVSSVFRGALSLFRQSFGSTKIVELCHVDLTARKHEIDSYLATIK